MNNDTVLQSALQYALRGWPVFPVQVWWSEAEGKWKKSPLVKEWPTVATCDPDQVREWFSRTDIELSIGGITGPSTFYVVDVDFRNGGTTADLPNTLRSKTRSAGFHYFFKHSTKIGNGGPIRTGVDFRGAGGFVVLPGSPGYEWVDVDVPMAELPAWIATRATHSAKDGAGAPFLEVDNIEGYTASVLAVVVEEIENAPEGERNNTLNGGAFRIGRFVGGGYLDEYEARDALEDAAETAGLGHQEAMATVDSGLQSGRKVPITLVLPGENHDEFDLVDELDADQVGVDAGFAEEPQSKFDKAVERIAEKLRISEAARRLVRQEQAELGWKAPLAGIDAGFQSALGQLPRDHAAHMVYELFGMKHNIALAAQYKTGKTTLGLNLVYSALTGEPFLDRLVQFDEAYSVAWFNGEMERDDFTDYAEPIGIPGERFALMHLRGRRLPILNDHVADWVIKWLVEHNCKLWVVDSWRRLCAWSGVPENSNEDVERLTDQIDYIKKESGVLGFLALAHTGRARAEEGEEHARGATALDDWVDARWVMTKKGGQRYMYAEGRKVHMEETALTYDPNTNVVSLGSGSRRTVDTSNALPLILAYIESNPGTSGNQIELHLDGKIPQKVVRESLKVLKQQDAIHVQPGPKNSKLHFVGPQPPFVARSTS